jgi:hypothetical protein
MSLENWISLVVAGLGVFAGGHMIGYHRGWVAGYWTDHPYAGDEGVVDGLTP